MVLFQSELDVVSSGTKQIEVGFLYEWKYWGWKMSFPKKKSKEFGKNDVRQNHKFDNEMKFSQKRRGEYH